MTPSCNFILFLSYLADVNQYVVFPLPNGTALLLPRQFEITFASIVGQELGGGGLGSLFHSFFHLGLLGGRLGDLSLLHLGLLLDDLAHFVSCLLYLCALLLCRSRLRW